MGRPGARPAMSVPAARVDGMFFDGWSDLTRVLVVGSLAYLALVAIVRTSGKRTLSKLNAFDLIVSVALGSTLATVVLNSSVSFTEGVLALGMLILLQFAVSWTSTRLRPFRRLVKSEPTVLLEDGHFLEDLMRANRVTPEEVRHAVRAEGFGGLELVSAVVLETDGKLSVIGASSAGSRDALVDTSARQRRR